MLTLWRYMVSISNAAHSTSLLNLSEVAGILEKIDRMPSSKSNAVGILQIDIAFRPGADNKQQPSEVSRIPLHNRKDYDRCTQLIEAGNSAIRLLHQTCLQQIVVLFERCFAEVVYYGLLADEKNIVEDASVPIRELMALESYEDLRRHLAFEQTSVFLRSALDKQIAYIKDKFGIDLSQEFKKLPQLRDLVLRRHMIVHGTSFSKAEYQRKRVNIAGLKSDANEDPLHPTEEYIQGAWDAVYALGTIFGYLILRQMSREAMNQESRRERNETSHAHLNHAAYEAIRADRYAAAEEILSYYLSKQTGDASTSEHALMAKVNLAQALRWQENGTKSEEVLTTLPRGALNVKYELCIEAIRNNPDTFCRALKSAANHKMISVRELCDWPVFRAIRRHKDFSQWVSDSFGVPKEDVVPMPSAPLVISPEISALRIVFDQVVILARKTEASNGAAHNDDKPAPPS